ncbi:MAG TPA: hypothetical protein DCZ74_05195 [Treponema sp.]|nr:hypothetical protein [Treponema sp.]
MLFLAVKDKISKMRKHPIKKIVGLTALYAALIVGIFVLQFKTESVLNRVFGDLHVSFAQTQADGAGMKLKNQFQAAYRGITVSASENFPVQVFSADDAQNVRNLTLESFTETPSSIELHFDDGSTIAFSVGGEGVENQLAITASPANEDDIITVPYKTSSSYTVEELGANRMILSTKDQMSALTAPAMDAERLTFAAGNNLALYGDYDPAKHFEFVAVSGLPMTDSMTYNTTLKQFRDTLVTRFAQQASSATADSLTESEVVAYVAEMAGRNMYNEAIDTVPDSFKKGNRRTYVSAPFFDTLVAMDRSLNMETERMASMVNTALSSKNPDIFTMEGIGDYILREKNTSVIASLLQFPGRMEEFTPSVAQASGLMSLYAKLYRSDGSLAGPLEPLMEKCISVIGENAKLENGELVITEGDMILSTEQYTVTGTALIALGGIMQHPEYAEAGRLLVNKQLSSMDSLSLQTLANLYPVLVEENTFYPHTKILGYYGTKPVWAWTCARDISYRIMGEDIVNINIDFPQNYTHYVIFKGVPTFHARIEIQQLMFRTDPSFEIYNSSGYVYHSEDETFFLKSRHKSQNELIRLWCDHATNFTQK